MQRYLVCYDYGAAGVWFWLTANSVRDVRIAFPELEVAEDRPVWMTDEQADRLDDYELSAPPQGLLNILIEARGAAEHLTGRDRPVFTVGAERNGRMIWALLRARHEVDVVEGYPELVIRHGRDPEWVKQQREIGALGPAVYDINELPGGMSFFDAIEM